VIHFQIFFQCITEEGEPSRGGDENTSRMKALYNWERDSLEESHDAKDMDRSALKQGKTLCRGSGHANQRRGFGQK